MASASAVKAGKAYVEIGADSTALGRGLAAASAKLKAFGQAIGDIGTKLLGLGTTILAPLGAVTKLFADMGSKLVDASDRTGVSIEALSTLGYAAQQSGADLDTLEKGLKGMAKTLDEASKGGQGAVDTLEALGLSLSDLQNLTPDQQFKLLSQQIAKIEDPSFRAAMALDVFGRAGVELLPLMKNGAAGIAALQAQARQLGLEISGDQARAAEEFGDRLSELWAVIKQGVFQIGSALLPVLQDVVARVRSAATAIADWIKDNRELVVSVGAIVLKIAAFAAGAGVAMIVIGKLSVVIAGAISAVRGLVTALTFLAAHPVLGVLAAIVATVGAVGLAFQAATGYTARLSDQMQELLSKGDDQRQLDALRLQRLEQLAASENLNNAQMKEAASLIDALQGRYGDLGIVLDKTSGKLLGVADAHAKVAAAMRKAALAEVEAALAEAKRNKDELEKEMEAVRTEISFRFISFTGEGREEAVNEVGKKVDVAWKKIQALHARRRALAAGDQDAVMGAPDEAAKLRQKLAEGGTQAPAGGDVSTRQQVEARKAAAEAAQKLAQIEEEAARRRMDAYEREIAEIRKLAEEREKLIQQVIAGEKARPDGGRVDELLKLQRKLADLQVDTEQQVTAVKARQEEERRRQAEETAQYLLDLQRQLAEAQGDTGQAAQIAADLYRRRETQRVRDMKLSAQQEAQALALVNQVAANMAKLPDNGKDIAEFMLQLRRQAAEASGDKAQVAKLDEAILRRQMAERIDTLGLKGDQLAQAQKLIEQIVAGMGQVQEKRTIGAAGTFNAMEARGLGAGGVADRIAKASEETAKNTKKLVQEAQMGQAAFE